MPTTCMTFLGFELDTDEAEVRLPESKVLELKELLRQWQGKRSCTPKELESLIGKLGHAAQVVVPGKTFLRRIFELKLKMDQIGRWYRLNAVIHSDFLWWDDIHGSAEWSEYDESPIPGADARLRLDRCLWQL